MKKVLSILLSIAMLVSVSAVSFSAFAVTMGSYESTTTKNKVGVQVNGNASDDVTYERDPENPGILTFTYEGNGELEGWEFPGLTEGVDYEIISEDGNSITIEIINGYEGPVIADALVKNAETKDTTKKNGKDKSPSTGVVSATGLAAAGAGAAILLALRKKEDAE